MHAGLVFLCGRTANMSAPLVGMPDHSPQPPLLFEVDIAHIDIYLLHLALVTPSDVMVSLFRTSRNSPTYLTMLQCLVLLRLHIHSVRTRACLALCCLTIARHGKLHQPRCPTNLLS